MSTKSLSRRKLQTIEKRLGELEGIHNDLQDVEAALALICKLLDSPAHRLASLYNRLVGRQELLPGNLDKMLDYAYKFHKGRPATEIKLTGIALPMDIRPASSSPQADPAPVAEKPAVSEVPGTGVEPRRPA